MKTTLRFDSGGTHDINGIRCRMPYGHEGVMTLAVSWGWGDMIVRDPKWVVTHPAIGCRVTYPAKTRRRARLNARAVMRRNGREECRRVISSSRRKIDA